MQESEGTIIDQVNAAYSALHVAKESMQRHQDAITDAEEEAIMDILDEWQKARSNEVRRGLVTDKLEENLEYQRHRKSYREARNTFRLAQIEVERCKTLIAAIQAGSVYIDLKQQGG